MTVHRHSIRRFSAILIGEALAGKVRPKDAPARTEAFRRPLFALTLPASLAFALLPALLVFAPRLPIRIRRTLRAEEGLR